MGRREGMAVAAQGAGPLTAAQRRALAVLARRAYEAQKALGAVEGPFDEWRHAALADVAPSRPGLTRLTQADFAPARDWLSRLAGGAGSGKGADELRAADELRRARWALSRECARLAGRFEGGEAGARRYAASLLGDRAGGIAADATAAQVWQALYTLRARAARRAGKDEGRRAGA